jgi:hypothetical protein
MPAIAELRQSSDSSVSTHPESFELYLPSLISPILQSTRCPGGLPEKEKRLRVAQADDAIFTLQRLLRVRMGLWHYKGTQVGPSQRASTHTRSMISHFEVKISRCAERYRAACQALLSLDPDGDFGSQFQELKPEHIRSPHRDDDDYVGEGHREISWIWLARRPGQESQDEEDDDSSYTDSKFLNVCHIPF